MPDTVDTAAALLTTAAGGQGPGDTLRIVLLVSLVGGALLAWFLLRGYGAGTGGDGTPGADAGRAGGGEDDANA